MDNIIIEKTRENTNEFNSLFWVLQARNKKDVKRINLMLLEVNENCFTCVDGHQLHTATIQTLKIPSGLYQVIQQTKKRIVLSKNSEDDIFFPTWKNIFPEKEKIVFKKEVQEKREVLYLAIYKQLPEGLGMNPDFIDNLLLEKEGDVDIAWEIFFYDSRSPIQFVSGDRIALIMPTKY
jgi:hypothetical protein